MNKTYHCLLRFKDELNLPEPLDADTIYLIGEHGNEWLAMYQCPCGCGNTVNLILAVGAVHPQWKFTIIDNRVTFSPSIHSTGFACGSHYHIINNVAS